MKTPIMLFTAFAALFCVAADFPSQQLQPVEPRPIGADQNESPELIELTEPIEITGSLDVMHGQAEAPVLTTFATEHEGFRYRAYQVKWCGHDVIASDPWGMSNYVKDDTVMFLVSAIESQDRQDDGKASKHLGFNISPMQNRAAKPAATTTTPSDGQSDGPLGDQTSEIAKPEVLTEFSEDHEIAKSEVLAVFSADHEGSRFRAYRVKWRGNDVIVSDTFAGSKYAKGDAITFTVRCIDKPIPRSQGERAKVLTFSLTEVKDQAPGLVPAAGKPSQAQ